MHISPFVCLLNFTNALGCSLLTIGLIHLLRNVLVAIWLIKVLVLLRLHLVICARFAQIVVAMLAGKYVYSVRVANITIDVWIVFSFWVLKAFSATWTGKSCDYLCRWHSHRWLLHVLGLNRLPYLLVWLGLVFRIGIRLMVHVMPCIISWNHMVMVPNHLNLMMFMNICVILLLAHSNTATAAANTSKKWTKHRHPGRLSCWLPVGRVVIVVVIRVVVRPAAIFAFVWFGITF